LIKVENDAPNFAINGEEVIDSLRNKNPNIYPNKPTERNIDDVNHRHPKNIKVTLNLLLAMHFYQLLELIL